MMQLEDVLPTLACAACEQRSGLEIQGKGSEVGLTCPVCGQNYPYRNGILDMVSQDTTFTRAQKAFLAKMFVKPYDIIRHSPLWPMFNRLSSQDEKKHLLGSLNLSGDETLLDLPCGTGHTSEVLLKNSPGLKLIGCDLSARMMNLARDRLEKAYGDRLFLIRADAMRLPFMDNSFSKVSSVAGLQLYPEPYKSLEEISRVMSKDNATFAGWTPSSTNSNRPGPMKRLWGSFAGGITFVDKVQMENKLVEEGFREFVWQPHGFISSCFAAHR